MNLSMIFELASILVTIIALIFIWYQLRLQTKQMKFNALTEIHKDVFTKDFREALGNIFKEFKENPNNLEKCKSKKVAESIMLVAGLYDLLGVRVQENVVPKDATLKTEWKILFPLWKLIKDFIYRERKARGVPYKEHLEWLANEARKYMEWYYPFCDPKISPIVYNDEDERPFSESTDIRLRHKGRHLYFLEGVNGWEYVHRPNATGGVAIIALTNNNEILLVEQYRIPLRKVVIELPAGLVGVDEKIEDAVKRELLEETGYICKKLTYLCEGPALPGLCDEINSIYLAEGVEKEDKQGIIGDVNNEEFLDERRINVNEGEEIKVRKIPLQKVVIWFKNQVEKEKAVVDLRVYAGLFFLKGRKRKLLFPDKKEDC